LKSDLVTRTGLSVKQLQNTRNFFQMCRQKSSWWDTFAMITSFFTKLWVTIFY